MPSGGTRRSSAERTADTAASQDLGGLRSCSEFSLCSTCPHGLPSPRFAVRPRPPRPRAQGRLQLRPGGDHERRQAARAVPGAPRAPVAARAHAPPEVRTLRPATALVRADVALLSSPLDGERIAQLAPANAGASAAWRGVRARAAGASGSAAREAYRRPRYGSQAIPSLSPSISGRYPGCPRYSGAAPAARASLQLR